MLDTARQVFVMAAAGNLGSLLSFVPSEDEQVCPCLCLCLCLCLSVYTPMSVCVHAYVCLFICLCLRLGLACSWPLLADLTPTLHLKTCTLHPTP